MLLEKIIYLLLSALLCAIIGHILCTNPKTRDYFTYEVEVDENGNEIEEGE